MSNTQQHAGAEPVGTLSALEAWEASTVLNLRLWCDGPKGQAQVWNELREVLSEEDARSEVHVFEDLIQCMMQFAQRPLVRHAVTCSCMGADEGVFLHMIRTASLGQLNDAALIAMLLVRPTHAEKIALMAGQVGACARRLHAQGARPVLASPADRARLH